MKRGSNFLARFLEKKKLKQAQITVFVIIAIILVAGIVGYFIVRNVIQSGAMIDSDLAPAYDYYLSCVEDSVLRGAGILGSQAGYINLPDFESGSEYAPFSSELDFMGQGVPYWYYISGNGVVKEQVPTISEMEEEMNDFLAGELKMCDFTVFRNQGYSVSLGDAAVNTKIQDNKISARISQSVEIIKTGEDGEDKTAIVKTHDIGVVSGLGASYSTAKKIYDSEMETMFLENYAVDVMYLYAPVSGAKFGCSPLVWDASRVAENITSGLEANMQMIKIKGDYYSLSNPNHKYFVADIGEDVNEQINFIYDSKWPARIEIWPAKGGVMIAKPVNSQQMASIGACYTAYKFVYDIYFPVLIQVLGNQGEDIFQFPIAVVVSKNKPRQALEGDAIEEGADLCDNADKQLTVDTYNYRLNSVDADLEFKCLASTCSLGKTSGGSLTALVPACLNGILTASADGYAETRQIVSTNEESYAELFMNKLYKKKIEVYIDGKLTKDSTLVNLELSDGNSQSIMYPQQPEIEMQDGQYTINIYTMKSGSITLPEKTVTQCTNVREGVAGFFGIEKEKCFDTTIPSQTLANVLYAGGSTEFYAVESELQNTNTLRIYANSFGIPKTTDELQKNYEKADTAGIDAEFV